MAYVISKDTHLHRSYKAQRTLFWWSFGLGIGVFAFWLLVIFGIRKPDVGFVLACPVLSFCFLFFAKTRYDQLAILAAGIRGEKLTLDVLKELDSEHWIITDKTITWDGKSSELDFVVIGPTGVCIIECKHMKGKIIADPEEKYWNRIKVSHSGVERAKNFYSPIKQVNTHLYRLKKILQAEGILLHLDSAVFFPDPESQVRFQGKQADTPVFWGEKGNELLLSFIRKPRNQIDVDDKAVFFRHFKRPPNIRNGVFSANFFQGLI